MTSSFRSEILTNSNSKSKVSLEITHKTTNNIKSIYRWTLKLNNKKILTSKSKNEYLGLWKYFLPECLNINKINKILIVGGGAQLLSNYLLKYPCDITIVDPSCFLYLQPEFSNVLKTKMFVNKINNEDKLPRKMIPIDMSLQEAYEDGILLDESFDLILVDNYLDTFYEKTGLYTKELADLYFLLLKDKGNLIINHNFSIKRITSKLKENLSKDELELVHKDIEYYENYLNHLNDKLCETDHIFKNNTKLLMYSKVFTGFI